MNGAQLAQEMGFPASGLQWVGGGLSAVIAGYTTGGASLLVVSPTLSRPPKFPVWLARIDPRDPGDGPSYMIDASVVRRYHPDSGPIPPVPKEDALTREGEMWARTRARTRMELNASDANYWDQAAWTDTLDILGRAPGRLADFYGNAAGGAIKVAFNLGGAAFGAFYGALPTWVQVAIPVGVVGVGVAGAVAVIRTFRGAGPG